MDRNIETTWEEQILYVATVLVLVLLIVVPSEVAGAGQRYASTLDYVPWIHRRHEHKDQHHIPSP